MSRFNAAMFCALAMALAFACADSGTEDPGSATCGDNVCAAEEVGNCTADCGSGGNNTTTAACGNGACETTAGENGTSCPVDCGGGTGSNTGSGTGSGTGTGTCPTDPTECVLCLFDMTMCPTGLDQASCQACLSAGLGGTGSGTGSGTDLLCTGGAPDGTCDSMENTTFCPSDCP